MKKNLLLPIIVSLMFIGGVANAQTVESKPGLTPESTLYFLDRLGENLQEFFTFNKEAKARLQIKFANERIAEIKLLVETKGPETKGIEKAKALLIGNVAHAAAIIQEVKSSGKDVAKLAKELDDKFDTQEQLLVQTFQDARKKLNEGRLLAVQNLIEQAKQLGNLEEVKGLKEQAQELVSENKALKEKKDEIKELFRVEKKKIEEELDDEDQREDEEEEELDDEDEDLEDEELDEEDEMDEPEEADEEEMDDEDKNDEDNESNNEGDDEEDEDENGSGGTGGTAPTVPGQTN